VNIQTRALNFLFCNNSKNYKIPNSKNPRDSEDTANLVIKFIKPKRLSKRENQGRTQAGGCRAAAPLPPTPKTEN
jgi:hypothetical protein